MLDPAPGHVGDVQQAVDAAEVDERAEVGDVLDHARAELTDLDLGSSAWPWLRRALFDQLAAAEMTMLRRSVSILRILASIS
jgi:hypothetical protein